MRNLLFPRSEFHRQIKRITGIWPKNIRLYQLSLKHSSFTKGKDNLVQESNERLEFLGDSVLNFIIGEYLFKKYPYKNEGFLTDVRARIVNGDSLNSLAKKLQLHTLLEFERNNRSILHSSMYGDAVEALIAAVYLDHGFKKCRHFVLNQLLLSHFDIEHIVLNNPNHKSKLLEWTQKNNKTLRFEIVDEKGTHHHKVFTAQVWIDDTVMADGAGNSKKKAEQEAANNAYKILIETGTLT